jgi:hypothetical protein
MAKWGAYSTSFPGTTAPAGWFGYGTRTYSDNKLHFPITGSNFAGLTRHGDDLLASHIFCKMEVAASGQGGIDLYDGGTIRLAWLHSGTSLTARINGSTIATLTYSATDHAWLKIREAAGTAYFETSPTGADGSWTVRASGATPAGMDTADCDLHAGGGTAGGGEYTFASFNIPGAGGPNEYDEPLVDTASTSDAVTAVLGALEAPADTASTSDAVTEALTLVEAVLDSATSADELGELVGYLEEVSDSLAGADALSSVASLNEFVASTASIDDLLVDEASSSASEDLADAAWLVDHLADAASGTESLADAASSSDAASDQRAFAETAVDAATSADALTDSRGGSEALTDALGASEALVDQHAAVETPADTLTSTDSLTEGDGQIFHYEEIVNSSFSGADAVSDALASLVDLADLVEGSDASSDDLSMSELIVIYTSLEDLIADLFAGIDTAEDLLTAIDTAQDRASSDVVFPDSPIGVVRVVTSDVDLRAVATFAIQEITAMLADRTLKEGQLLPPFQVRLGFADSSEDLTEFVGLSTPVTLTMKTRGSNVAAKIDAAAATVRAVGAGWVDVEYEWQEGDTDTTGLYFCEFTFDVGGKSLPAPTTNYIAVRVIPTL